ncbi:uncharacterized protein [Onthophagus taurus]|uniref:uncharacterized protein n=1 Tax=Onthophagus taurus TaxID=166361 RepID=UPI0039BEC553
MEEKLIEAVRRRTILYDTSHRDYMKSKLKSELWEEVTKEADLKSGAAAKSVWEKLRHSLRDALRRQKKVKRSGAAAEAIKLWKFQKEMGFLQPFTTNRMRDGILQGDSDCDDAQSPNFPSEDYDPNKERDTQNVMSDNDNEYEGGTQSPSTPGTILNTMDGNIASTAAQSSQATPITSFPKERKNVHSTQYTKMKKNNIAALIKNNMEFRQQMSIRRSEERKQLLKEINTPSDPLYHFFISMYETVKTMPPASQLTLRNKIYQGVSNMEATLLNLPGTTHSSQQTCNPSVNVAGYSYNETHGSSQQTCYRSYAGTPSLCSSSDHNSTMDTIEDYPHNTLANLITTFFHNTN